MRLVGCFVALLTAWLAAPASAQAPPGGYSELYSFAFYFRTPARPPQDYFDVMQPGDVLDVGAAIRVPNEGSPAPAGASTAAFVLSDDPYFSPDDLELHRWRVPALGQGESAGYFLPPSVVVPDVPRGYYFVLLVIDIDEEVAESDESNLDSIRLNVGGTYYVSPDLIAAYDEDYGLDEEAVLPGENVSVEYGIRNQTSATYGEASGPFTVGYVLRRAYVGPAPDRLLDTEAFQSIDAGDEEGEFEQLTIAADTPPGEYVVCVERDLYDVVVEYNESNSACYRLTVTDPLGRPFLSAVASNLLRLPRTLAPGTSIRMHGSVRNRGASTAPAAHLGLVLSTDEAYSPDDYVLTRFATEAIPPGTFSVADINETTTVPDGVPPGAYVAIFVPDVDNVAGLPPGMRQFYGTHYVTVPGVVAGAEAPSEAAFALDAPWPNPTSGAAQVSFALAAPGEVRLAVVDVLGREVAVLDEGVLGAGMHEAAVPPGLAPGLYVVRLNAANQTRTQTLIIVR